MPDVDIVIRAEGGDASAAEIAKTSNALKGITTSSSQMESQFSHRFTHIGLQLFATDLLRTSGLGTEARQIIGGVQAGIMSAGAAFGAAAGPIMLVGSAIAAVVGIAVKLIEKHKAESEALAGLIAQQEKSKEGYDTEIKALEKLRAGGVALTRAEQDLLEADKAVAENIKTNLLANQEKEINALIKQRDELGRNQSIHEVWVKALSVEKAVLMEVGKTIAELVFPAFNLLAIGVEKLIGHFASLFGAVGKHISLTGQFKQKYEELTAAIDKMRVQHALTTAGVTTDIVKELEARTKANAQMVADRRLAEDRITQFVKQKQQEIAQARANELNQERQQSDNQLNYWIKTKQAEVKAQDEAAKKEIQLVKTLTSQMTNEFGSAFAKSIVEGQDFGKNMEAAFTRMAESFIEKVIAMTVEWLILKAIMDIWPGGEAAYASTANAAYPMLAQTTYSGMNFGGAMASGGSALVNQPTMFIAGESGPEIATFTPLGQADNSSSGGASIGSVNLTLNISHLDGNDPAGTLDALSDQIRRETVSARRFATTVAGVASRYPNAAY